MTRNLTTVLLLAVATLTLAADAPKAEPPFKHPRAVQAWKRWQYRSEQLRQQYERALAEERKAYLDGLDEAAKAAAQTGALDEVKAIATEQATTMTRGGDEESDITVDVLTRLKWTRSEWTYQFRPDGTVDVIGREADKTRFKTWSIKDGILSAGPSVENQPYTYKLRIQAVIIGQNNNDQFVSVTH